MLFFTANTRSKTFGFTLLEMMAATLLASLLFVALTSLLRSFANQERWVEDKAALQPPVEILTQQLRRDLTNAQYIDSGPSGIRLLGTIAQDWTTRQSTGRRAEVTYRVTNVDGENWLLRREVHLDASSTSRAREEPVWRGVAAIELLADQTNTADDSNSLLPRIAGMSPAPSQIRLVLRRASGKPLLNLRVQHHWEDF